LGFFVDLAYTKVRNFIMIMNGVFRPEKKYATRKEDKNTKLGELIVNFGRWKSECVDMRVQGRVN